MTTAITIKDLLILESAPLRSALELIDQNAQGLVFAIEPSGKMTGILTDGDIRRALLKGSNLDTLISAIMRKNFNSLPITTTQPEILKTLTEKISSIPLLDEEGKPVDFASVHRLHRIPVMEPSLKGNELNYVLECVKTNWISSQGKFVIRFEDQVRQFLKGNYSLAVSNGTTALHLALVAMGIGKGDEVIVPDLTFAASASAVIHAGAVPVFIDVKRDTWTLDPDLLEACITPKTKAIMPVHLYGHPCDMDPILEIAKKHKLLVVEDAAESFGALYKDRPTGALADAGCFSFFGNKMITTGEGGMIIFKREEHYKKAKILRDHGMTAENRYWHLEAGFNYRLTNIQAAVGVAQLEQVQHFIDKKISLAQQYMKALKPMPGLTMPPSQPWAKSVFWLFTILLEKESRINRDDLIQKLLQNGIESRPVFYPLHHMPPFKPYTRHACPVTEDISKRGICLPSSVTLTTEEIDLVSQVFKRIFGIQDIYKVISK